MLSSAVRSAWTCPSIIAEGATISAPALAWLTATFAKASMVLSLSIFLFTTRPQCPWEVYWQRQTSVIIATLLPKCLRKTSTDLCTMPSPLNADFAFASFCKGKPNRIIALIPSSNMRSTSTTSLDSGIREISGIEGTSWVFFNPSWTKIGAIRSLEERRVSCSRFLTADVVLRRRSLTFGKELMPLLILVSFIVEQLGHYFHQLLITPFLYLFSQIIHRDW